MSEVAVYEGRLVAWVPGRIKNPNNGSQGRTRAGMTFRAIERKAWVGRTSLCVRDAMNRGHVGGARWRPDAPKVVVLTAFVHQLFDDDGLAAALKPVVDGLRNAGLLHDDSPSSGHRIERRQQINRKHRGVEVIVEPRAE